MEHPTAVRLDPKLLYRRLDSLFGTLEADAAPRVVLAAFLRQAFEALGADLRLESGRLYAERSDGFELIGRVGRTEAAVAEQIDLTARPLALVLRHGVYLFPHPEHEDAPAAHGLLPRRPAAALAVGRRPDRYVMLLTLADGWGREELDFTLNTIRAALGSRLMEERVRGSFRQAAEIQQSLLVEEPPAFPGYDLAARSVAADEVGGDFYDFMTLGADLMGFAIGDASGHGLPAALLVRDVVTGLRMGLEKHLKIAYVFGKLNEVIHRSNLSSRFVSVFYGELEEGGNILYVNAGHPPPLLFSGERVQSLETGGTVIGPLPEARFRRGVASLAPGDQLVLCTDGVLERHGPGGEFGEERLRALVRASRGATATELVEAIFAAAQAWGGDRPWDDDATALVVRRL